MVYAYWEGPGKIAVASRRKYNVELIKMCVKAKSVEIAMMILYTNNTM